MSRFWVNTAIVAGLAFYFGFGAIPQMLTAIAVILGLEWVLFAVLRFYGIDYRGEVGRVRDDGTIR